MVRAFFPQIVTVSRCLSSPLDNLRMTLCQEVIQAGWVDELVSGQAGDTRLLVVP